MRNILLLTSLLLSLASMADPVEIEIVCTTDVHGAYFHHNYLTGRDTQGGLDRLSTMLRQEREKLGDNVVYIDNGDILQGQPTAYYYNFEDTASTHLSAAILNYLGCDLGTLGNHDVEPGPEVYNRWIAQCDHPVLAANVLDAATGQPWLKPYELVERDGVKIAFLGMLTPAIPCWLPENLWKGLAFEDIEESARKWVPIIQEREQPDFIIGVFHAGQGGSMLNNICDNPTDQVAERVAGFDAILFGHDHKKDCRMVANEATGDSVAIVNAGSQAYNAAVLRLTANRDADGRIVDKNVAPSLVPLSAFAPDPHFAATFAAQESAVKDYVDEKIGTISETITCADALYGPCAFMDLIHELQLAVADNAQISISAPLALNAVIQEGDITIRDMFNLYKYENLLYTMALTGQEVKDLLEMSYDLWTRKEGPSFNYDSAYGIIYTVDPAKENGQRVEIKSLADGTPFSPEATYRVAVNSYRGNGGGALLTDGAGIPKDQLPSRILASTDKDLRYYLIEHIRKAGNITPCCAGNWTFIPTDWGKINMAPSPQINH